MTVKELISKLQTLDSEKQIYLGDNELNEDTFYYKVLDLVEVKVENQDLIVLTYRS